MTKCARCGRALVATEGRTEAVCATCLAPPFKSSVSCLPNADTGADENYAVELERAINTPSRLPRAGSWIDEGFARDLEIGPGIAALDLRPPPRQPSRRKTTSWDPDMPLEDAEPGRYGWRS